MRLTQLLVPVVAILVVSCICDGRPPGKPVGNSGNGKRNNGNSGIGSGNPNNGANNGNNGVNNGNNGANNGNNGNNGANNGNRRRSIGSGTNRKDLSLCTSSDTDRDDENRPTIKNKGQFRKNCKGFKYIQQFLMGVGNSGKTVTNLGIENLQAGVKKLQRMAGLNVTGTIDEQTARAMTWPRCGNSDNVSLTVDVSEGTVRDKRFVTSGGNYIWSKVDLTYKIKNYPDMNISVITEAEVDEAVANSFKLWSDATPLTFTRVPATSSADIVLVFGKETHTSVQGDPAFDGQGGTLAHAFTPNSGWGSLNGDVHYDDDETFTHKKYFGRNLQYVTSHEVGHALGLDHSNTQGALMWPFILSYTPDYRLPEDDKLGIQAIYGINPDPPIDEPTVVPPTTTEMPLPIYCNLTFDDVEIIRGEIFAFSGKKFWRFSYDGHLINPVEGTTIRGFFKRVPSVLNAIVERWFDEKILIIKGKNMWQLTGNEADDGYPKPVADLNVPKLVDCALHRASEGITYYFKEKLVYAYDEYEGNLTESQPVKVHHVFNGIPRGTRVTAAFTGLDGYHYLIVDRDYYKVDPYMNSDGALLNFGEEFLRCPTT